MENKKVIVAMHNPSFANGMKMNIDKIEGYTVVDVLVSEEDLVKLLETTTENLFGLILTSDLAKKLNDYRLDYLSDLLLTIRERYPELKIVILASEKLGHPFLAELVDMGIYNIFLRQEDRNQTVLDILKCFEVGKSFSEVSRLRDIDTDIPWRRLKSGPNRITIETNEKKQEEGKEGIGKAKAFIGKLSDSKKAIPNSTEVDGEASIQPITIKEKIIIKDRLIGSMFIGITSVERSSGCTHLSLILANYLKEKGYKVAIVEANRSEDFFKIEYAYEGGGSYQNTTSDFKLKGITHYKNIDELNVAQLINSYEFVILDIGNEANTDLFEEFFRCHIKIVTAHGSEWRRESIERFMDRHNYMEKDDWLLAIPFPEAESLEDIQKETKLKTFAIPAHASPYESRRETNAALDDMLKGLIPIPEEKRRIPRLVIISGLVIVSILLCGGGFFFLAH
ncbi:hypothetical protein [Bacillus infantis]|uniref:hypothetical protein n=1 Tax=Bacillus infantis TaxID=324767 RepID=UPI00209F82B0|nr:hypothetical protein [Bacillus infantis]MCP1161427.1 hypothetical protein [Bacillus infantis]